MHDIAGIDYLSLNGIFLAFPSSPSRLYRPCIYWTGFYVNEVEKFKYKWRVNALDPFMPGLIFLPNGDPTG